MRFLTLVAKKTSQRCASNAPATQGLAGLVFVSDSEGDHLHT